MGPLVGLLLFLLTVVSAEGGDLYFTPDDITVPESGGCLKHQVTGSTYTEQRVDCELGEKFYVKLPADDSMTAAISFDLSFSSPGASGTCSGWLLKLAAFIRGEVYDSKAESIGSAGSVTVPHDTSTTNVLANKTGAKTMFNAQENQICVSDSACDNSAYIVLEMERTSCGGGDIGADIVRSEGGHLSW